MIHRGARFFSLWNQALNLAALSRQDSHLLPWKSKEAGAATAPLPTVFFQAWNRCIFGGMNFPVGPFKARWPVAFADEVGGKTREDLP